MSPLVYYTVVIPAGAVASSSAHENTRSSWHSSLAHGARTITLLQGIQPLCLTGLAGEGAGPRKVRMIVQLHFTARCWARSPGSGGSEAQRSGPARRGVCEVASIIILIRKARFMYPGP